MAAADQLIKPELWDRTRWRGVLYIERGGPDGLPCFALVFQHRDVAGEIFRQWHRRIGPVDTNEEIRVSIIEGDIPGQEPGYWVHLGPSQESIIGAAAASSEGVAMSFTRRLKMDGPPSPRLANFKRALTEGPSRYYLMAATMGADGIKVNGQHFIEKRHVLFRHVSEIAATGDVDAVVFAKAPQGPETLH